MYRVAVWVGVAAVCIATTAPACAREPLPLDGVRRVVFLGDSITYAGQYQQLVEACLRLHNPALDVEFLNLGLASETVSGLSEPGHAGGKFPRPDLHERLERVLTATRPDLVIACYGMNCGIYHPFSPQRFSEYQRGIRQLRQRAATVGAQVLHLTPPVFDPLPIHDRVLPAGMHEYAQPFAGYDEVLEHYSQWLLAMRGDGWQVVDVHGPMKRFLTEARQRDGSFTLARDGVHPGPTGHWLIAREVLRHWQLPEPLLERAVQGEPALSAFPHGPELLERIGQRQRLLRDAWLTETGHTRPGVKPGLPLDEATTQAQQLAEQIRALTAP